MQPLRFTAVSLVAVLFAACTGGGGGRQPANAYAAHQDVDFATVDNQAYVAAASDLAAASGLDFTALPGARGYGVRDVMPLPGGGHVLIAVEPGEDGEHLVLAQAAASGTTLWAGSAVFAPGTAVEDVVLTDLSGIGSPVLSVDLGEGQGVDRVYLALTSNGPVALRAEQDGVVANAALRATHPGVPTTPGALGSDDRFQRLAALLHLAAQDQAEARRAPAVHGHLEAIASGTDTWAAQAAADLLTR